ncbi:cysteine-rich CWC family protein [uncultured Oceanicoccus sp.]|uniref:cysteine-rich CWC family protein n=1 Tax=uncultured Oceanicoccus sp. TaxID=1706381 RepID=UPI0030D899D3
MTAPPTAQQNCPLCGQANLCAIANNAEAKHCWCMDATIPPSLIEQANQGSDEKICICQTCAQQTNLLAKNLNKEPL